jgi:hypothetical protein
MHDARRIGLINRTWREGKKPIQLGRENIGLFAGCKPGLMPDVRNTDFSLTE